VNLEFPLCREPRHEALVRAALAECVSFIVARVPAPALVAVVLTGSFARGEGTVLASPAGLSVLGDIEFFVVLGARAPAGLTRGMGAWGREVGEKLAARGVRTEVEFGPIDTVFLRRRARPSIFVWDLRNHGKVLWGREDVLAAIRPFGVEAIPPDDALALVFNRTVEQLATWERLDRLAGDAWLQAAYQRMKLSLDLAGSALAFVGSHTALYRERPAAFARLVAETPSLANRLPETFLAELHWAGWAKSDPAGALASLGFVAPPAGVRARLREAMLAAVPATTAVLTWELQQYLGADEELPALLTRYARTPGLGRRLYDWAKLILNPLPAPLPISHLRAARLVCRSTPRALLYAAAARAYLDLVADGAAPDDVGRLLPVPGTAGLTDRAGQRRAIVALWRWAVRNR
jgi:hypothetical protein